MLTIKDKKIYTENGLLLKIIDCPKKVSVSDLQKISDKNTCLKISKLNPMFRFM